MGLAFLALLSACGDSAHTLQPVDAAEDAAVTVDAAIDVAVDAAIDVAIDAGNDAPGPAMLVIAPSSYDFDIVKIGNPSAPTTFTVTNTGGSAAAGLTLIPHGYDQTEFAVATNNCTIVPAAASCTFSVAFQPTTIGAKATSFEMSAAGVSSAVATVIGQAFSEPGPLSVTPFGHDYGPVGLAQTASYTFTVMTFGGASETPTVSIGGANPAAYAIAQDTCTGVTLLPFASCTVQVRFHDTAIGARSAVLQVAKSDGYYSAIPLRGAIISGDGLLYASPSTIAIDNQPVGTMNAAAGFMITNNSATTTPALNLALAGDASEFPFTSDGCSGATLATGDSCWVDFKFAPTSVGAKQATVTVIGQSSTAVTMLGSSSFFTLSPIQSGNFYQWDVGQTSWARTFTITNVGTTTFSSLTLTPSGPNLSQFLLSSDTCSGATLAPNASCALAVQFAPTTTGTKSASYQVSAAGAGSISAAVTGNGIVP
jgi:hypothetical protein